ncbi:MAG: hypothetical protein EOO29_13435 [Comamonadaceae bacterium]|nr:MAG: hypothetical protein EOO29_13435 [Comamonadaceae bacterium]
MSRSSPWRMWPPLILLVACALLHADALQAGWDHDDPVLLRFATAHAPWQYFGVREVMLQQSYAHVTPWNVFFYDMLLPWVGLDARWHHLHLLIVLWLSAVATWALLRRWLDDGAALVGAVLFLCMPSTAVVAHLLMTGHYAYGLLFSVLAIHAWLHALERDSLKWASLAAAFYALACLCKELYAPLPAVLLFWPWGSLRQRAYLFAPVLAVAAAYAALRLWLFSGVGGYTRTSEDLAPYLAAALGHLGRAAVSTGWKGLAVGLLLLAGLASAIRRGLRPRPAFIAAGAVALLLPIVPVLPRLGAEGISLRLFHVAGWALAVVMASLLPRAPLRWVAVASLLAVLVLGQRQAVQTLAGNHGAQSAENQFLIDAPAGAMLMSYGFQANGYLAAMAQTVDRVRSSPAAAVIHDEDELLALGARRGEQVHVWDPACACMAPLGPRYGPMVKNFSDRVAAGSGRPLSVELRLDDWGRQKRLSWKINGESGTARFDSHQSGRFYIPREGEFGFGLDASVLPAEVFPVRVTVEAPDGAWVRTPLLKVPLRGTHTVVWPPAPNG